MKKFVVFLNCLVLLSGFLFAQELTSENIKNALLVTPQDVLLVPEESNDFENATGYHLYVRKIPGVESILLTETTKDPEGKENNYAYRAEEWNPINGNEIRYLDGQPLNSQYSRFSLVDSTTEIVEGFGECFHIYIPSEIVYGYPWSRNGTIKIGRGTFINVRSFAKKYADYTGDYYDNPFMFDLGKVPEPPKPEPLPEPEPEPIPEPAPEPEVIEEPPVIDIPVLTDNYNPVAAEKFQELSDDLIYSKGPETIVDDIMKPLNNIPNDAVVDCVFAIDATGSMKDDIEQLREEWVPRLIEDLQRFKHVRLGLILYRDYTDSWRYKNLPVKFFDFTDDLDQFLKNLNDFTLNGLEGGDIPEAVYEAMYASMEFFKWDPNAVRKVILIGDAEPHPRPRGTGRYTKDLVSKMSEERGITINAIILPDDKSKRGR